jgi:serine/threonine-protein kinase RsbW
MYLDRKKLCREEVPEGRPRRAGRLRGTFRSTAEVNRVLENVAAAMVAAGYPPRDVFGVRLALEEAIVNAVKHGNRGDPAKEVLVRYHVGEGRVLAEVKDQGSGFDPSQVHDPLAPANLERPSGRGLLLMRSYLSWVRYNRRGNGVTLCKRRSGQPGKG